MKLEQLYYLHQIVNNDLNLSQAAKVIGKSQPTVSKAIAQLEKELNTMLFHRNGKSLSELTRAGEDIVRLIPDILDSTQKILQIGKTYAEPNEGTLTIAANELYASELVPELVTHFKRQHSQVNVLIEQMDDTLAMKQVNNAQVDIAIVSKPTQKSGYVMVFPAYSDNRVLVVPKRHSLCKEKFITLETLAAYPFIIYNNTQSEEAYIKQVFKDSKDLDCKIAMKANSLNAVFNAVQNQLGIAVVPGLSALRLNDLTSIPIDYLFNESIAVNIAIRRDIKHKPYIYGLLNIFSETLDKVMINKILKCQDVHDLHGLFRNNVIDNVSYFKANIEQKLKH